MSDPLFPATVALVSTLLCMQERIDKAKVEEEIWSFTHDHLALLEDLDDGDEDWYGGDPLVERLNFRKSDLDGRDLTIEYDMYEGEELHQECRIDVRYHPPSLTINVNESSLSNNEAVYDIMTIIALLCMVSSDDLTVISGKKERLVRERRASMRLVSTNKAT